MWVIPPQANAAFVCAMEDILTVYTRPVLSQVPVICMDETSKQLTKESRIPLPGRRGQPRRYDYEYERNGVANLFLFYAPFLGQRCVVVTDHRTKRDWAEQIQALVDEWYPEAERIVLVLDNLNTHTGASLYETFAPAEAHRLLDRLEIHYTPKHGSWLNIAEIELNVLTGQCLNRRIEDIDVVRKEVKAWQAIRNNKDSKVNWQFTTDKARIKLSRLYPTLDK